MFRNYNDFIKLLKSKQDKKYKEFHQKLTFTKYEIIGIRVPILRSIALDILKSDYHKFLAEVGTNYYEEVFIEGLVIASLKDDELFNYFYNYLKKIDNWAICDSFCSSLKVIKKNSDKYFFVFENLVKSSDEFVVRVGLVILLNYYIDKNYLNKIFDLIDEITLDKYYVNMAASWLLAEMYIKYPLETKEYLERTKVNNFIFNKAISKICDSYRVDEKEKIKLKKLRR